MKIITSQEARAEFEAWYATLPAWNQKEIAEEAEDCGINMFAGYDEDEAGEE